MKVHQLEEAAKILGPYCSDSIAVQMQSCEAGRRKAGRHAAQQVLAEEELLQHLHTTQSVFLHVGDVVVVQHQQPHLNQVLEITAVQTSQTVTYQWNCNSIKNWH